MANTKTEPGVTVEHAMVAIETGSGTLDDGRAFSWRKGITRVGPHHPAVEKWPEFFKADDTVQWDLEDMTAEPGRKRGER